MTETVGLKLLAIFKEPFLNIGKDLKEEFLNIFNNGLSEYVDNFYDKYSKTKTFIYRDEKVNFYDIFFPVTLMNRKSEKIDSVKDLDILFANRKFITIIGNAGSGKSMLTKHIFLSAVDKTLRIPIVVELRNLNDYNGTIFDYISSILTRNKIANSEKFIQRILQEGSFLFLLDGYDEIYSNSKNKISKEIEDFVDTYSKNTFVLTSRPGSNAETLQRFDNFYVQPLTKSQINDFILLQFKNHDNQESLDRILTIVEKPDNEDYKDYLSNPLLLSMFIFTFNSYPELPKYKNKFYWNVFDTLCTKHDAFSKNGFWLHERKSKLLNDDLENILKWFSYISLFKGKYNFDYNFLKQTIQEINQKLNLSANPDDIIYDLTVSISILIQDGTEYTFPHKSLQEYFTSSLIKGLNEEQKEKIYSDKFNNLRKFSNGGNLNMFKLCFEMDKTYFAKYYLIPNGELFLSSINITNSSKMTQSFLKYFEIDFMISKDTKNKYSLGGYSYNNFINDSFLSFFTTKEHLPSMHKINKALPEIGELIEIKANLQKDGNKHFGYIKTYTNWNKKMFDFCVNAGITKNFEDLYKEVKSNLEKIIIEVENENDNTKDLLNI
jgi:hypothetical protein